VKIAGEELEEELVAEEQAPLPEGIEGYAEETRLHYSGGLSEAPPPELETFEAE
jgi:hypothetical protein